MILASLWFGKNKPKMTCYLEPLMQSLRHMETDGLYACINTIQLFVQALTCCQLMVEEMVIIVL